MYRYRVTLALAGAALIALVVIVFIRRIPNREQALPDDRGELRDGKMTFSSQFPEIRIRVKLPSEAEWDSTVIVHDDGTKLPQFVRKGLPATVGRVEIHSVEIPDEVVKRSREQQVLSLGASRIAEWRAKVTPLRELGAKAGDQPQKDAGAVKPGIGSVATAQIAHSIKVNGEDHPATTVSVWLVKHFEDGTHKQFRVTETFTVIDREDGTKNRVVPEFVIEQEVPSKSPNIINMADSMVFDEKTGVGTLKNLARVDPALEVVRDSFEISFKK